MSIEVDHQVGEDAAAEIPEPAPVAKAILVERLLAGAAEEPLPVDRRGIDVVLVAGPARRVAVPGEVHLVDLAELAAT